jgi:hypothetical protein
MINKKDVMMKQRISICWNIIASIAIYFSVFMVISVEAIPQNAEVTQQSVEHEQAEITVEAAKYIIALLEALALEEGKEASDAVQLCYQKIKSGIAITEEEFKAILDEIIEYAQELTLEETRAPRPSNPPFVVGVGSCDLGGVLTALRAVRVSLDTCCANITGQLNFLVNLINQIAIDLTITATSLQTLIATFSIFEQSVADLENTVTVLIDVINDFNETSTTIVSLLQGTFTSIDACCSSLNAEFINTWTILNAGFESTATILNSGFNDTYTSFAATWTILGDALNSLTGCLCISEFQQTWTILESLQNSFTSAECNCLSEFQQTWTILANLSLSVTTEACTFTTEFYETWTILAAGFNGTFTSFQPTFTALEAGFQGTFSVLEDIRACSFVTVFGDEVVGTREDLISIQFPYGISTYDTVSSTGSGGSVSSSNSMAIISSGTNPTGSAQLQSKRTLRYRAGHEAYVFFSAMFNNGGVATSTQWIGLLDSANGVAVGFNNTTFSVLYRNNGVNTIVPQSSFNIDPLDGTGASGFTLNPQTLNVYRIAYGWLGASPIRYQILAENGEWITFHQIISNNAISSPIFSNPMIPVTAQVTKTAGATNIILSTASWNAGIIGEPSNASSRYFAAESGIVNVTGSVSPTEQHILTVRNKSTFQSQSNKIGVRITLFSASNINFNNGANTFLRLRKSATVTGTSFTDVNTANSVMEYSTAGTYQAGTGSLQMAFALDTSFTLDLVAFIPGAEFYLEILPGETMTITAQQQNTVSSQVYASLSWEELF